MRMVCFLVNGQLKAPRKDLDPSTPMLCYEYESEVGPPLDVDIEGMTHMQIDEYLKLKEESDALNAEAIIARKVAAKASLKKRSWWKFWGNYK